MNLLLKQARVFDTRSAWNGKRVDILVKDGIIAGIGPTLEAPDAELLEGDDLCVSPGWMDIGALGGEPGLEHREDLVSLGRAAAAGGYTALAPYPNTDPVIQTKSQVRYLINHTRDHLTDLYPVGAITRDCGGRDLTEMYDMQEGGAIAFSDGTKSIQHGGVLLRALQYVKPFNGLVIQQPFDHTIAGEGQMHEGPESTALGMRGIPVLAESVQIKRDLEILQYADSRIHFAYLSTLEGVELIRQARKEGLMVTAAVAAMNLVFTDVELDTFDTNLKVLPPLRSDKDQEALVEGLEDGTIDLIASNHVPLDTESKVLEFPYADFGAIGLETAFAASHTRLAGRLGLQDLVERFYLKPRLLLGLDVPKVEEGAPANLTFFDPSAEWTYSKKDIYSKSANTPFIGRAFQGKVLGCCHKGLLHRNR